MEMNDYGTEAGQVCGRRGCGGVIEERRVENCSCHISPPCHECVEDKHYCPECEWQAKDDRVVNDYVVNIHPETSVCRTWTLRPLHTDRIDWHSFEHSGCSMRKTGVYPAGTTRGEVEKAVAGTFGGRFESFGDGKFDYIAYTD